MKGARALAAFAALFAVVGSLTIASADSNPDFDRGKELLDNLEYEAAAEAFKKALARGDNDPTTTATIYLRLGEIAASTGDEKEAIEHFRRALSIDLTIKLAKGTSPKVGKPFADARRGIDESISASISVDGGQKVAATLEIANDGLEMIRSAAVTYIAAGDETSAGIKVKGAKTKIPLPAGTTALEVVLLDRNDNRVVVLERITIESEKTDSRPDITPPTVKTTSKSQPVLTRWYLWGGLAVAAAAGGVAFGLSTQSALDDLDELKQNSATVEGSEALALEDKARSRALLANISFAAAGALAITAGIFFFTAGDDEPAEAGDVALTPTVTPDGVGVVSTVLW